MSFTAETIAAWIQEADNGSEEHQTKLGAHFLSLADADVNREENAAKAVQWLLQASRQGSEEATALLDKCTKTGTGEILPFQKEFILLLGVRNIGRWLYPCMQGFWENVPQFIPCLRLLFFLSGD